MNYRSITLCLQTEDTVECLTATANTLVSDPGDTVVGVHALPGPDVHVTVSPYIPMEVIASIRQEHQKRAAAIRQRFETGIKAGKGRDEWYELEGFGLNDYQPYVQHALVSDIVIACSSSGLISGVDLSRELLLHAGTPLLQVSADRPMTALPVRIAVAWNATVESARAVRDAMPLLVQAEQVDVLTVTRGGQQRLDLNQDMPAADIATYLARHGVKANVQELSGSQHKAGTRLLEHCGSTDTDLLVMGGFGHSRVYDAIFGAATAEVMQGVYLPIFLSH